MNIKQLIYESVKNTINEKRKQERLVKLVSEEVMRRLNEEEATGTKEREVQKAHEDPSINDAAIAYKMYPKLTKGGARSKFNKKFNKRNKDPRPASEKDIEKGHNEIQKINL